MKTVSYDVKVTRTIHTEEIEGTDFSIFRDIFSEGINTTVEGIALTSVLDEIEGLEKIEQKAYYGDFTLLPFLILKEDWGKVLRAEVDFMKKIENICYSKVKDPNYMIVLVDTYSNIVYDLHYKKLSRPVYLNYINGNIDNEHYHLKKLLEVLKKDERVLNRESLEISKIPYYNATPEVNEMIDFTVLLSDEDYAVYSSKDYYERTDYLMNLLGADACKKDN